MLVWELLELTSLLTFNLPFACYWGEDIGNHVLLDFDTLGRKHKHSLNDRIGILTIWRESIYDVPQFCCSLHAYSFC